MILFVTYCRWWRACHVLMSQGNEKLREVHRTERNLKQILQYQIIFTDNIANGFCHGVCYLNGCWLYLDWIIVAKLTLIIESNHIILYVKLPHNHSFEAHKQAKYKKMDRIWCISLSNLLHNCSDNWFQAQLTLTHHFNGHFSKWTWVSHT